MNKHEQAACLIRSLMRNMGISDHVVLRGNEGVVSQAVLDWLDGAHVGDGTSDAALAIGEHAFRAGFEAAANWFKAPPGRITKWETAMEHAWDDYDPPEHIKELS